MKRRDLIKRLELNGWWKIREGANHDIYPPHRNQRTTRKSYHQAAGAEIKPRRDG